MADKNLVRLGGAYVEITGDNDKLIDALKDSESRVQSFSSAFAKAGAAFSGIGVGITAPMKKATEAFAEFEKQMLITQNVTKAQAYQMKQLTRQAKQLGASTSWTTAQVAQGMVSLGRMGFSYKEIEKTISHVMDLGRALDVDVATASKELGAVMRQFGADASQAGHYADALASATNNAAIEMSELLESMKYVGAAGNAIGADVETVLALTMALRNSGVSASQAGTQLRSMFLKFQNPKDVALFADKFNVDIYDAEGRLKSFLDIMVEAQGRARTMGDSLAVVARRMFGTLQAPAFITLLKSRDLERFRKELYACDGAAEEFRKSMESGVYGALKLSESAIEAVGLQLGESLAPSVDSTRQLIQDLSELLRGFIQNNAPLVNTIAKTGVAFTAFGGAILAGTGIVKGFSGAWSLFTGAITKARDAWVKAGVDVGVLNTEVETLNAEMAKLSATAPGAELAAPFNAVVSAAEQATFAVKGLNAEMNKKTISTPGRPYFARRTDVTGMNVASQTIPTPDALKGHWARSNKIESDFFASVRAAKAKADSKREDVFRVGREITESNRAKVDELMGRWHGANATYNAATANADTAFDVAKNAARQKYQNKVAEQQAWGREQYRAITENTNKKIAEARRAANEEIKVAGEELLKVFEEQDGIAAKSEKAERTTALRFKLLGREMKQKGGATLDKLRNVGKNRARKSDPNILPAFREFKNEVGDLASAEVNFDEAYGKWRNSLDGMLSTYSDDDREYIKNLVALRAYTNQQLREAYSIKDSKARKARIRDIVSTYKSRRHIEAGRYVNPEGRTHSVNQAVLNSSDDTPNIFDASVGSSTEAFAIEKDLAAEASRLARGIGKELKSERAAVARLYAGHADAISVFNERVAEEFGIGSDFENDERVLKAKSRLTKSQNRVKELEAEIDKYKASHEIKNEEREKLDKSKKRRDAIVATLSKDQVTPTLQEGERRKLLNEYTKLSRYIEKSEIGTVGDEYTKLLNQLKKAQERVAEDSQSLEYITSVAQSKSVRDRRNYILRAGEMFDRWADEDYGTSGQGKTNASDAKSAAVAAYVAKRDKANARADAMTDYHIRQAGGKFVSVNARVGDKLDEAKAGYYSDVDAAAQKRDQTKADAATARENERRDIRVEARQASQNSRANAHNKVAPYVLSNIQEQQDKATLDALAKLQRDRAKEANGYRTSGEWRNTEYDSLSVKGTTPPPPKGKKGVYFSSGSGVANGNFTGPTTASFSAVNETGPQYGLHVSGQLLEYDNGLNTQSVTAASTLEKGVVSSDELNAWEKAINEKRARVNKLRAEQDKLYEEWQNSIFNPKKNHDRKQRWSRQKKAEQAYNAKYDEYQSAFNDLTADEERFNAAKGQRAAATKTTSTAATFDEAGIVSNRELNSMEMVIKEKRARVDRLKKESDALYSEWQDAVFNPKKSHDKKQRWSRQKRAEQAYNAKFDEYKSAYDDLQADMWNYKTDKARAKEYASKAPSVGAAPSDTSFSYNASTSASMSNFSTSAKNAADSQYNLNSAVKETSVNGKSYSVNMNEAAKSTENLGQRAKRSAFGLQALKVAANVTVGALKLLGGMAVSMLAWTAVMTIFQKIAEYAHKTAEDMRKAGEIAAEVADKDKEAADEAYANTDSDTAKIDAFIERAGSSAPLNSVEAKRLKDQYEYLKEKGILTDAEVVEDPDSPSGYRILNAGAANTMKARAVGLQVGELEKTTENQKVGLAGLDPSLFGANGFSLNKGPLTIDEMKKRLEDYRSGYEVLSMLNSEQRDKLFGKHASVFVGHGDLGQRAYHNIGSLRETIRKNINEAEKYGTSLTDEQKDTLTNFLRGLGPETLKAMSDDNGEAFLNAFKRYDQMGASQKALADLQKEQAAYQAEADKEKNNPYESQYDKDKRESELQAAAADRAASFEAMRKTLDEMTLNRQEDNLTASEKQITALKRQWEDFVKGAGKDLTEQERKDVAEMKKLTDDQIKYLQGKALEERKQETNDKLEEQFGKVVNDLRKVDYKERKITRSDDEGRTFYTKTVKELDYDNANKDWEKLTAAIDYYKKRNVDLSAFYQSTVQGVKDVLNSTKTMLSTTTTLNTYEAMQMSQDVALDTERQQLEQMRRLNDNARKIYDWMTNQDEFKEYL